MLIFKMTPELEKQVASLIEAAKQTGSDVASFVQQQAPDLMDQIVRWKFYDAVIWSSIGAAVVIAGLIALVGFWIVGIKSEDDDWIGVGMITACAAFMVGATIFCNNIDDAIKAKVAPKLVAIEAISGLVKGK